MFSALINNVAAAAEAVVNAPNLPPQVQSLRSHAAEFPGSLAPELRDVGGRIIAFAQTTVTSSEQLQVAIAVWKSGSTKVHDRILFDVRSLLAGVQQLMQGNETAFAALSRYRDQIIGAQRTVGQVTAELNAQLAGLRSRLSDTRGDLEKQVQTLNILRAIPFPLPWAIAQIASLISSSRTLEQRISDVERQLAQLNGEAMQVGCAQATVEGFTRQLQVLENSMQNVINAVSITQGQLTQIVGALDGGQQTATPIVVEAYLASLKGQADNVIRYLSGA